MKIRIATRKSPLALFQAEYVANQIKQLDQKIEVELMPMSSEGDLTDKPLHQIGGKGLFIKTLESALLNNSADIAVHSLKDVPAKLDKNFKIISVFERAAASDILLTKKGTSFKSMPEGSIIGTSSPRRKAQIKILRPDLNTISVRGNIATRIKKLHDNHFDGLIIAKAAMERLNLSFENTYEFSYQEMLPAASQGFIAIECISSNNDLIKMLDSINSEKDMVLAEAERSFVAQLNGSCLSPIAIYCREESSHVLVSAKALSQNGDKQIFKEIISSHASINEDIRSLAKEFISKGADKLILS